MEKQAADSKRDDIETPSQSDSIQELAETIAEEFIHSTQNPSLESIEQLRERKKLQMVQELEQFRASFSRGYAVILAELQRRESGQRSKI